MVIPNMVMKFDNFEIMDKIGQLFDLSSALACRVESINIQVGVKHELLLHKAQEIFVMTCHDYLLSDTRGKKGP